MPKKLHSADHPGLPRSPMLTRPQVCKLLNVETHTIARWVDQGDLVGHKLGSTWRFDPDDIADFLRERSTSRSTGFTSPEAVA